MATSIVTPDNSAFVLATSAADAIVQNVGTTTVVAVFAASLPAANTQGHLLKSGMGVQKSQGVPADNIYVKGEDYNAIVAVSE